MLFRPFSIRVMHPKAKYVFKSANSALELDYQKVLMRHPRAKDDLDRLMEAHKSERLMSQTIEESVAELVFYLSWDNKPIPSWLKNLSRTLRLDWRRHAQEGLDERYQSDVGKTASIIEHLDTAIRKLANDFSGSFYPDRIGFPRMKSLDGSVIMLKRGDTFAGLQRNLRGRRYVGPYFLVSKGDTAFHELINDDAADDNFEYDFLQWTQMVIGFLSAHGEFWQIHMNKNNDGHISQRSRTRQRGH